MYAISFRTVGENILEFDCSLCIHGGILNRETHIPYKYHIPNQSKPEYLHGARFWGEANRCLQVPSKSFKLGGMFFVVMYSPQLYVRGLVGGKSCAHEACATKIWWLINIF